MKFSQIYPELQKIAARLPEPAEGDYATETAGAMGRLCATAYKPIMDSGVSLDSIPKSQHETYRSAIGYAIHSILKNTKASEATLAGVALPAFTRAKIAMVMRAYPKLVAPQLIGFFPMRGPTALAGYKVAEYADAYTASSPAVAAGDDIDDPTKVNTGYRTVAEGGQARKVTFRVAKQTITATTKRIIAEWSQDLVEDSRADWDLDAESELMNAAGDHMAQAIDVDTITVLSDDAPSGHDTAFDMTPAASPDYASLAISEQREYRELLIKDGVVACLNKINQTNKYHDSLTPTWALCSPKAGQSLEGVRGFTAVQSAPDRFGIETGPVRFVGTMNSVGGGLNVFVSQFYGIGETTTGKILFGRKSVGPLDRGVRLGMYIPLQLTDSLYDPNTDLTVKGLRSRYAFLRKDGGVADSDKLVDIYGELTITL